MGEPADGDCLQRAKSFILDHGGLSHCRIFTRIHLALFGLIPWKYCPTMPIAFIELPAWAPVSIYDFSSWARSCLVPLMVLLDVRRACKMPPQFLSELYTEKTQQERNWSFSTNKGFLSFENLFIQSDKILKRFVKKIPQFLTSRSQQKCEQWIREHVMLTEDIFPALAYSAMALHAMGYSLDDPAVQKCWEGIERFQIPESTGKLPALSEVHSDSEPGLYQQCCISPVWDTPWAGVALIQAGTPADDPGLIQAARWLISKQILHTFGDWSFKNKKAAPGGWSFEFDNDYFPDTDDTVQVLQFLHHVKLPESEKMRAISRGLAWLLGMQSDNGGWAAFDVDNTKEILNQIPFADHKACLDQPSADITGRVMELLALLKHRPDKAVRRALRFIEDTQEDNGSWMGRWGVNYIYGTWCAVTGLTAMNYKPEHPRLIRAKNFLCSIQNPDGSFGESCHSYVEKRYIPLGCGTASQTAWALMALCRLGLSRSDAAQKAARWLCDTVNDEGTWNEPYYTGTGFPGHFYIRYHGYRHYFPVMALGIYKQFCT
jgi:squalene-hopene/tetraprenyl-beta-curcumene cyclase